MTRDRAIFTILFMILILRGPGGSCKTPAPSCDIIVLVRKKGVFLQGVNSGWILRGEKHGKRKGGSVLRWKEEVARIQFETDGKNGKGERERTRETTLEKKLKREDLL